MSEVNKSNENAAKIKNIKALEEQLEGFRKKELKAQNVKFNKQKIKYYTGFTNSELFEDFYLFTFILEQ